MQQKRKQVLQQWIFHITGLRYRELSSCEQATFKNDTLRNALDGVFLALEQSVFLLILVKYFRAPDLFNSLVSSAKSLGLFSALFVSALFATSRLKKSTLVWLPTLAGGLCISLAGIVSGALPYTLLVSFALMVLNSRHPLFIGIYAENYRPDRRGKLYSLGVLGSYLSAILCGFILMRILDLRLDYYRITLVISGMLVAGGSLFIRRIPSAPPNLPRNNNPVKNLGLLWSDHRFGLMIAAWFIMGFANLWTIPIQMVHLAEKERGLNLPAFQVMLISGVIPFLVRLSFNRFWAHLFDKLNIILLRIILNLLVAGGLFLFFISRHVPVIIPGVILYNTGLAGGAFAWNLWVTRFAPPGKSQVYMSIHTFMTGVRGLLAPYIGFFFIDNFSISRLGLSSAGLILLSTLMILPLLRKAGERHAESGREP